MIIGIPKNSYDYCDNFEAIRNDSRFSTIELDSSHLPNIDVLIVEGICGGDGANFVSYYENTSTTIIVWQTGIWTREINNYIVNYINACNLFMGYDEYIEKYASSLGKQIWTHFPLFHDKFNVIKSFDINRQKLDCIYSANICHPNKLGYSSLYLSAWSAQAGMNKKYIIYYDGNTINDYNNVVKSPAPNTEYRQSVCKDMFYEQMNKDCKMIFQLAEGVAWGKNILDAVRLGIPSVSNTFYQRILYPDLYCQSIQEAQTILSWPYNKFRPFVDKAQNILTDLLYSNAKKRFTDYLWNVTS